MLSKKQFLAFLIVSEGICQDEDEGAQFAVEEASGYDVVCFIVKPVSVDEATWFLEGQIGRFDSES